MPRDSGARDTSSLIFFYGIVAVVILLDQLTKFVAVTSLGLYQTHPILENIFHFTLVHNKGVAFGMFRDHPEILTGMISVSLILLLVWAHKSIESRKLTRWAMALIIGGAFGNWIDRVRVGAVIDFLDFRVWPVFNLADCAISVGVGLYILSILFDSKKDAKEAV